jgi:5-methylcytosine-specific restriction endonuclease McrA
MVRTSCVVAGCDAVTQNYCRVCGAALCDTHACRKGTDGPGYYCEAHVPAPGITPYIPVRRVATVATRGSRATPAVGQGPIHPIHPIRPARTGFVLTIELVPEPCWYSNMRKAMSPTQWDHLRHEVYQQYGHRCGICGASREMLHCHERWSYDDQQHIQRLEGFIALCVWCHHVKHIGLAGILADQGQLDYEQVAAHFLAVNTCERADFEAYRDAAFALWNRRNRAEWTTDLGAYAALVTVPPQSEGKDTRIKGSEMRRDVTWHERR